MISESTRQHFIELSKLIPIKSPVVIATWKDGKPELYEYLLVNPGHATPPIEMNAMMQVAFTSHVFRCLKANPTQPDFLGLVSPVTIVRNGQKSSPQMLLAITTPTGYWHEVMAAPFCPVHGVGNYFPMPGGDMPDLLLDLVRKFRAEQPRAQALQHQFSVN